MMTSGLSSSADRRAGSRLRTLQRGRICYGLDRALSFDCVIRNLTDTGAMLRAPAHEAIPERFILLHINGGVAFEARLAWRRGEDTGVQFLSRHDLKGAVTDEYRALRRVWVALAPD